MWACRFTSSAEGKTRCSGLLRHFCRYFSRCLPEYVVAPIFHIDASGLCHLPKDLERLPPAHTPQSLCFRGAQITVSFSWALGFWYFYVEEHNGVLAQGWGKVVEIVATGADRPEFTFLPRLRVPTGARPRASLGFRQKEGGDEGPHYRRQAPNVL